MAAGYIDLKQPARSVRPTCVSLPARSGGGNRMGIDPMWFEKKVNCPIPSKVCSRGQCGVAQAHILQGGRTELRLCVDSGLSDATSKPCLYAIQVLGEHTLNRDRREPEKRCNSPRDGGEHRRPCAGLLNAQVRLRGEPRGARPNHPNRRLRDRHPRLCDRRRESDGCLPPMQRTWPRARSLSSTRRAAKLVA
jgi:hypothetical protein